MSFTLVIPTHNRSSYLKKNLSYLNKLAFEYKIIVADSSDDDFNMENQKVIQKYKDLDVSFFRLQGKERYTEKVLTALDLVDTETLMICGDDDFVIPEQIKVCSEFLMKNNGYSIALGKIAQFECSTGARVKSSFLWKDYQQQAIESKNVFPRLIQFMRNYRPTFYSVHRTKNLRKNFRLAFTNDIGRSLGERMLSILDVLDGKVYMVNNLFMLRHKGHTLIDDKGERTWPDDIGASVQVTKSNLNFDEYKRLLMEKFMTTHSMVSISNADQELLCDEIENDFEKWQLKKNSSIISKHQSHQIFKSVKNYLRPFYHRLKSRNYINSFVENDRRYFQMIENIVKKTS